MAKEKTVLSEQDKKDQLLQDALKAIEKEYGKGNVFIRWINNYWNTMFIIHQKDAETFEPHLTDSFKVNGRVLNALTEKGLIKYMDIHHEEIELRNDQIQALSFLEYAGRKHSPLYLEEGHQENFDHIDLFQKRLYSKN